jgi:purine catabolism regulator
VGFAADNVSDAIAGLTEAADIAEAALSMHRGERTYFRASDVRLRGLVSLLRDDRRVQRFAETELKALLSQQETGKLSDLEILREHVRLAGNKSALAERLHISRPLLYKRLAAIRDALGVDLDDGESMASLHVALLIHDVAAKHAATSSYR